MVIRGDTEPSRRQRSHLRNIPVPHVRIWKPGCILLLRSSLHVYTINLQYIQTLDAYHRGDMMVFEHTVLWNGGIHYHMEVMRCSWSVVLFRDRSSKIFFKDLSSGVLEYFCALPSLTDWSNDGSVRVIVKFMFSILFCSLNFVLSFSYNISFFSCKHLS